MIIRLRNHEKNSIRRDINKRRALMINWLNLAKTTKLSDIRSQALRMYYENWRDIREMESIINH